MILKNYLIVGRAVKGVRPHLLRDFFVVSFFIVLSAISTAAVPLLLRETVNAAATKEGGASAIFFTCAAYAVVWSFSGVADSVKGIFSASFLSKCDAALNKLLLYKVFFSRDGQDSQLSPGEISSEIERAAVSFSAVTAAFYWSIVPILLEFAFAAFVIGKHIGWMSSLYYLVGGVIVGWLSYILVIKGNDIHSRLFSARSAVSAFTVERISLLHDLRINKAQYRDLIKADEVLRVHVRTIEAVNREMGIRLAAISAALGLFLAAAVSYVAYGAYAGRMSSGDFVLIGGYSGLLAAKLRLLAGSIIDLGRSNAALTCAVKYLNIVSAAWKKCSHSINDIKFSGFYLRNVGLRVGNRILFDGLNFHIPPGKMTVIMGPSGVGKTTLLNTLLGFHIPSVGAVEIVGKTPDALGFNYLLELVSYAPQSASVFSGTLRENLLYGVEAGDVTDYNLDEVINILQFQTDVENKEPLTKDSVIGNGGRSLSGGEKQRISIGRALLRKKNILILDEPTSALDKQTARYIMEEIRHRVSTIIVVSHDPDVIAMGDVRIDLQIFRKVIDY